jgi:hypothetical protein
MAFCNSCGAALNPGIKFCNKCGAAVAGGPAVPAGTTATPAAPPTPTGGSSALKIILIVFAVIVTLGILGIATIGFIGYRFAKNSHVKQEGDKVKVETPFGTFSANDPEQAVRDLGVDVYPGAEVQKNGAASVTVAGIHTVTASFESSDSVDKVCSFYKAKFPSATVTSSDQNRCTIVSSDRALNEGKNSITINIESSGDNTKFQVTNVSKTSGSSN